jgi:hypothetical protein
VQSSSGLRCVVLRLTVRSALCRQVTEFRKVGGVPPYVLQSPEAELWDCRYRSFYGSGFAREMSTWCLVCGAQVQMCCFPGVYGRVPLLVEACLVVGMKRDVADSLAIAWRACVRTTH